jgi:hypothetical protein
MLINGIWYKLECRGLTVSKANRAQKRRVHSALARAWRWLTDHEQGHLVNPNASPSCQSQTSVVTRFEFRLADLRPGVGMGIDQTGLGEVHVKAAQQR